MNKIAIFSVPRSGSTWLGQIFNSHPNVLYKFQPNFAYSFKLSLQEFSSPDEIAEFYDELVKSENDFINARISISGKQNIMFSKDIPSTLVFKETHYLNVIENLIKNSNTKVVGLVRSPFATINSWLSTPKEFKENWDVRKEWNNAPSKNQGEIFNYFGYKRWKEAVQMFIDLNDIYPNQFYLLKYETLLEERDICVSRIFDFCGLTILDETKSFLNESKGHQNEDPYSVFKSKVVDDQWQQNLPDFIIDSIKNDQEFKSLNSRFKWI